MILLLYKGYTSTNFSHISSLISSLSTNLSNDSTATATTPTSATINTTINDDNVSSIDNDNNNPSKQQQVLEPPPCIICSQDRYVPITNVNHIMRRILPPTANIFDDAKEVIQECVTTFISFIASEANDYCHHEQCRIVTAKDLTWAIEKLVLTTTSSLSPSI